MCSSNVLRCYANLGRMAPPTHSPNTNSCQSEQMRNNLDSTVCNLVVVMINIMWNGGIYQYNSLHLIKRYVDCGFYPRGRMQM